MLQVDHQILQMAIWIRENYSKSRVPTYCKWLKFMQGLARRFPLRHTLHSLHPLVIYFYRVKKQRLRKLGLCLCVGQFGWLVSSSIMLLPFTSSLSDFCPEAICHAPSGHLLTCLSKDICLKTFADL